MSEITLSISITTVLERHIYASNLFNKLKEFDATLPINIIYDSARNGNWANSKKAWNSYSRLATHHLVIQEDTWPSKNFYPNILNAIKVNPDNCISLYSGYEAKDRFDAAMTANVHWYKFKTGTTAQGLILPTNMIIKMLKWTDKHIYKGLKCCDDQIINAWVLSQGKYIWQTVPELIDHLGEKISSIEKGLSLGTSYNLCDGSLINWNLGRTGKISDEQIFPYFQKWYKKWFVP